MENTCCGDKCPYVQQGFCKSDSECPHYIESWWTNDKEPEPKLIRDCFPKRASIQQSQNTHRVFALQQATEELRNRIATLENLIMQLIMQNNSLCVQNENLQPPNALEHSKNKEIGEII